MSPKQAATTPRVICGYLADPATKDRYRAVLAKINAVRTPGRPKASLSCLVGRLLEGMIDDLEDSDVKDLLAIAASDPLGDGLDG
jgi:hypothetical protein